MALLMGLLEVLMYDIHMRVISLYYYVTLFFMLCMFVYLYRYQIYIEDKDYLEEMIEHHSMAILTSDEILQKTKSERVKKLAESILTTQEKEIDYMRQLLKYDLFPKFENEITHFFFQIHQDIIKLLKFLYDLMLYIYHLNM
jgi:hypothetical protein